MFNISHIDHVVLDTSDLDKCVHFYVQAFSMHAISWKDSVALRFGSQKINIHPVGQNFSPVARTTNPGGKIFALQVKGDNALANLKKFGTPAGDYGQSFMELEDKGGQAFLIAYPDNDLVIASTADCDTPEPLCLKGILLGTANLDGLLEFYAKFLGAYVVRGNQAAILKFENGYIGLLAMPDNSLAKNAELEAGSGDFCLIANGRIKDIYGKLQKMKAPFADDSGIVARQGALGPINSVYMRDPDGNLVEISTYADCDKP